RRRGLHDADILLLDGLVLQFELQLEGPLNALLLGGDLLGDLFDVDFLEGLLVGFFLVAQALVLVLDAFLVIATIADGTAADEAGDPFLVNIVESHRYSLLRCQSLKRKRGPPPLRFRLRSGFRGDQALISTFFSTSSSASFSACSAANGLMNGLPPSCFM